MASGSVGTVLRIARGFWSKGLHPMENPDRYLLRMTSASDIPRLRTHRVAVWLLSLYLTACLGVSAFIAWSPWLHLVLEHGSFNQRHAHRHSPAGQSALAQDPFFGFPESTPPATSSHHHPHPHTQTHEGEFPHAPTREPIPPTPDHSHHGLPQLLAAGLVDLPEASVTPIQGSPEYRTVVAEFHVQHRWLTVFDWTQAARPPPLPIAP